MNSHIHLCMYIYIRPICFNVLYMCVCVCKYKHLFVSIYMHICMHLRRPNVRMQDTMHE